MESIMGYEIAIGIMVVIVIFLAVKQLRGKKASGGKGKKGTNPPTPRK